MIVWLNGYYKTTEESLIPITDRGFLLGDGIFETLYYDGHQLECLEAHLIRLKQGLDLFHIPLLYSENSLHIIILDLLLKNNLNLEPAAVRITLTRGTSERGLAIAKNYKPTLLIQCFPYKRERKVLKLGISQYRHPGYSLLSKTKHLGYQLSILGRLEAQQRQLDDVIFLNSNDEVVCSTSANIFALIRRELITPPLTSGCLPGIKRGQLIKNLRSKKDKVSVRPLLHRELTEKADEIFLTNSLIDKQWAYSIEAKPLKYQ